MPGEKPEVNSYHVLEIHSHSVWDSSHEQIQAKGGKKGAKRHFKFQAESCEVSVQIYVCLHPWIPLLRLIGQGALFNWPKEK